MMRHTITLAKPIQAHGEEVKELKLREPLGGDIRACGMPMTFSQSADGQQKIEFNTAVIALYISKLCDIPPSSVDQLAMVDFTKLMEMITSFFDSAPPP